MSIFLLLLQLYLTVIWTASTFCFCFYDKNFYFNSFVFHIAHASHSVVKSRLFRMPCSLFRNGLECSLMTQNVVITPQIDKIHFCLHTSLLLYCIYVNCVGVCGGVCTYMIFRLRNASGVQVHEAILYRCILLLFKAEKKLNELSIYTFICTIL